MQTDMWQQVAEWQPDVLSIVIGIFAGIVAGIVLMRLISREWAAESSLLDRWRAAIPWSRGDIEADYRSGLLAFLEAYHLGGNHVPLGKIFVPPRLIAPDVNWDERDRSHWKSTFQYALWPATAARLAIPPPPSISVRQLLLGAQRVVISSPGGTGKSTLLAYCAYLCLTADSESDQHADLANLIPVFSHIIELHLAGLDPSSDKDESTIDPITPLVKTALARTEKASPLAMERYLRQKAGEGRLLVLLDGWDEITPQRWKPATIWLTNFLSSYPDNRVFVAGPLQGFGVFRQLQFNISGILPWRIGQVQTFGSLWAKATRYQDQLQIEKFWEPGQSALETYLRLQACLHNDKGGDGSRPLRRVELMELSLLDALPDADSDTPSWLAPATRELWQEMAYRLLQEGLLSLSDKQINGIIETVLVEYDINRDEQSVTLLRDALVSSPIIVRWPSDHYAFLTPPWRDYLAAGYMAQSRVQYRAIEHVYDSSWRQALGFYAGRIGATELAQAMLAEGRELYDERLFTLATWLPDVPDTGEWRGQLMIRLGRLVVDETKPRVLRQQAASVMAITGEEGVTTFMRQLLRQPDPALRQVAIAAIALLAPAESIEVNRRMMRDADAGVRSTAIHAVAWINEPTTQEFLFAALAQPDDSISRAAAESLALNGTAAAFDVLRESIHDAQLQTRYAVVSGLALIDEPWAFELLTRAAGEDDQWVIQTAAEEVLRERFRFAKTTRWRPAWAGEQSWLVEWVVSRGQAVPVGKSAIPFLTEALVDKDSSIRAAAAMTIGQLEIRQATSALQASLNDPNEEVRYAAFAALCQIGRAWDEPVFGTTGIP